MDKPVYENSSQQRIIKVILLMFGHEVSGIAPGDIAKSLKANPSAITKDLANLLQAGLAERLESGLWRLTPVMPQKAMTMLSNIERAKDHLDETRQRYTRTR